MGDKLNSIIEGWKNLVWLSPEIEKLAKARAEICNRCESNVLGVCIKCNCVLSAKVRSIVETCPKSLW